MLGGRGIPAAIIIAIGPESAIELAKDKQSHIELKGGGTNIMFDKPQLVSRHLCICYKGSIMSNKRFELPTKRVPLDPVDHEATIAGAGSNAVIRVDEVKVVVNVLPAFDEIVIWIATPIVLNHVSKLIAEPSASCWIWRNNHIALVSKNLVVPACAP